MRKLLTCILLIISLGIKAQTLNWEWAKAAVSSADLATAQGNSVTADASGNVYVTGSYADSVTFGTTVLTAVGSRDIFVVKYDPLGNVIWAKSSGGIDIEEAYDIAVDGVGNVYITGYFKGTPSFFDAITLTSAGASDIFIAKYNSSGNVMWAKSSGGSDDEFGNGIALDISGNICVTGTYKSSSINFGATSLTNSSSGYEEIFIVKYDPLGNHTWSRSEGSAYSDWGSTVSIDPSGNIYLSGSFTSIGIVFGTTTIFNTVSSGTTTDIFIVKYDFTGNPIWAKKAGGNGNEDARSIATDASGNIFVTGSFYSTTTFETTSLIGGSGTNVYLAKYDTFGGLVWVKDDGGSYDEYSNDISIDQNGNIYIIGTFSGPTAIFGTTTLTSSSTWEDTFITKYDSLGNFKWATSIGGGSYVMGKSIYAGTGGDLFTAGYFCSPTITIGTTTLTNLVSENIYVAKANDPTSVFENSIPNTITIYPNPTSGKFLLDIDNTLLSKKVKLEVYNTIGELILEKQITSNEIDLTNFAKGVYFIKVYSNDKIYSGKVILE